MCIKMIGILNSLSKINTLLKDKSNLDLFISAINIYFNPVVNRVDIYNNNLRVHFLHILFRTFAK